MLKVLTEILNYVFIGFFQILCNFYDENDDLFYTISLSTAMGSINKLSTIKSVFIVPINKSMNKIKINFFIMPKIGKEDKSAKFIIQDINSNKIYIKYYQKTDKMFIKNIEDSLNTLNNISANLEKNKEDIASNLEKINDIKKTYLKNVYNILLYNQKTQVDFREDIFYEKIFDVDSKKNDFIEIDFKILLEYSIFNNRNLVKIIIELLDENNNSLYIKSILNNEYTFYKNKVFIIENIFYNFVNNIKKLKFIIKSNKIEDYVIKLWYIPMANYRLVIKIYGL